MMNYLPDEIEEIAVCGQEGTYRGYIRFCDDCVFSFNETMNIEEEQPIIDWLYANWNAINWSGQSDTVRAIQTQVRSKSLWHSLFH
jgi:hypothetical protein